MQPGAYFLPGIRPAAYMPLSFGAGPGCVTLSVPVATPDLVATVIDRVTAARNAHLAKIPVARIIDVIDATIARWMDPSYPLRQAAEDFLPAVTGYSRPMVSVGLPELLKPFRADGLRALVRSELGDPPALDAQQRSRDGRRMVGPRLTTHILAGNIPAVPVESIIHALLVKSASIVKPSSGDPLFPALFAQSLADVDQALAESIAVLWWKGGETTLERHALEASDAVIAYGSDEAITSVRRQAPPAISIVAYGPRISFAMIGRESLRRDGLGTLAAQAAWDVAFFDQQGCVSPHAIFVERGGEATPLELAEALASEMQVLEERLPRGRLRPGEISAIQQLRGTWELRRAGGQPAAVFQSRGSTSWTVLYEEDGPPAASCLNRLVRVIALDDLATVPDRLRPLRRYLQTMGIALTPERVGGLAHALAEHGITRVCPLGRMQHPPATWQHDGRPNLLDLVRWMDVEDERQNEDSQPGPP